MKRYLTFGEGHRSSLRNRAVRRNRGIAESRIHGRKSHRRSAGRRNRLFEGYNYYVNMLSDVEDVIDSDFDINDFEDAEDAYETLYDYMWDSDAVTGNLSHAYRPGYFDAAPAVIANLSTAEDALYDFGYGDDIHDWVDSKLKNDKYYNPYEYMRGDGSTDFEKLFSDYPALADTLDIMIRCYELGGVLEDALAKRGLKR